MERKEAIEVIKKNWPDSFTMLREALETLIPELKESEDEKIIKWLICYFKEVCDNVSEKEKKSVLAWLEKQDEQIDFANKEYWRGYREGKLEILDKYADLEKQGKQKLVEKYNIKGIGSKNAQGKLGEMIKNLNPADKVEPKFHEGEWITDGVGKCQIRFIDDTQYWYSENCILGNIESIDKRYHLWTIQDAKPGDVLVCKGNIKYSNGIKYKRICLFNNLGNAFFTLTKISNCVEDYGIDVNIDYPDNTVPATKEQKEILFMVMKDAGYTFDFEKKELKKIEQKPAWSEEDKRMIDTIIFDLERHGGKESSCYSSEINYLKTLKDKVQSQVEWGEEDERLFQIVIDVLDRANHLGNISRTDLIACVRKLKSLKDRVQPKQEWNEEDEANLNEALSYIKDDTLKKFIKSLRPRKQWKPSEEQMEALKASYLYWKGMIKEVPYTEGLESLYEQLKKL